MRAIHFVANPLDWRRLLAMSAHLRLLKQLYSKSNRKPLYLIGRSANTWLLSQLPYAKDKTDICFHWSCRLRNSARSNQPHGFH
jgi:hypothetical protein